jgi:DNA-binding MarR family transcriptional regulator
MLGPLQDFARMDLKLWTLLSQARHSMYRFQTRRVRQYGISISQAAVLVILRFHDDNATPANISLWLMRSRNSTSQVLSRMEKDGLITKSKDLDKKNLVRVTITDKGIQIYRGLTADMRSARRIIASLLAADRKQLRSYLLTLRDSAVKELGTQKPPWPKSP